jgi:hypothetical protein
MQLSSLQTIRDLLATSRCSVSDQQEFLLALRDLAEPQLDAIAQSFVDAPRAVTGIVHFYQIKQLAHQRQDRSMWRQIIEEEAAFLNEAVL